MQFVLAQCFKGKIQRHHFGERRRIARRIGIFRLHNHAGIDISRTSKDIFEDPDRSYEEKKRKRAIALEELQELFILNGMDGRSTEAIKNKTEVLKEYFGSSSKTFIEEKLALKDLLDGICKIKERFFQPKEEKRLPPPGV